MYEQADRSINCYDRTETNIDLLVEVEEDENFDNAFMHKLDYRSKNSSSFYEDTMLYQNLTQKQIGLNILEKMSDAGYIIDVNESSKVSFNLFSGQISIKSDGLVMEYKGSETAQSSCNKHALCTSNKGYYPSLWKYHIVSDSTYKILQEDTLMVLLPKVYVQSQMLMAFAKISHILLSIINRHTHEMRNIWLCFDLDYRNKCIQYVS